MERPTFDQPSMPAVFVLSAPRSGSTLLRYILDTHSRIASPGELLLGYLCADLKLVLSRTLGLGLPAGPEGQEPCDAEVRRIVSGILEAYARSKGKDVWCDKTPYNVYQLDSLFATFPEARYVCLYRDCLDTVTSMLRGAQRGFMQELVPFVVKSPTNLVAAMIDAWCDYTGKILAFEAAHPASCFRIRYEDLVRDPPAALRPLFEFLGVGWEQEVVERALSTPHDEGGGDMAIRFTRAISTAAIGQGASLPFQFVEPALAPMNALLARLGYPRVDASLNAPRPEPPAAAAPGAEHVGTEGDGSGANGLAALFLERLPAALGGRPAEAAQAGGSVKFVIEGRPSGTFWVDLGGEPKVLAEDRPADCVITLGGELLLEIVRREINPFTAFQEGRIRVHGPLPLAAHVMELI